MDNTPAKKCRISPKNRHIRPPFSPFYLRKCLTNSGCYIIVGTEENSNAICSLQPTVKLRNTKLLMEKLLIISYQLYRLHISSIAN